jgi:hypothetical protein
MVELWQSENAEQLRNILFEITVVDLPPEI